MKRTATLLGMAPLLFVAGCAGPGAEAPPPARARPDVAAPAPPSPPSPPAPPGPTVLRADQLARAQVLAAQAGPFFAAYNNFAPVLSADGRRVFFLSKRTGAVRLYGGDVARPAEEAVAVGDGAGRVQWAAPTPDGRWLVYMQDMELFRALPDGTGASSLTPGERVPRYLTWPPRDRPGTLVYSVVADDPPATKLFALEVATGAARLLRTDPGELPVAAVAADASRALLLRMVGDLDHQVLEVSTAGGAPRRIFPPEGTKARVSAVTYAAEGKRALVATDEGGEAESVLAVELATGRIDARYQVTDPATARVEEIEVSPKGDLLAVGLDLGNRNEVRILDARTLKLARTVATTPGTAYPTSFTRDGKSFGLYLATPERPGDAYRVDARSGRVDALRSEPRPSLPAVTAQVVAVPAFDGLTIPTNVYLPSAPVSSKLRTLVFLHGGPDYSARLGWRPRYAFLASLGFAVVEPNIRGSTGFGRAYRLADHREKRGDALRDVEAVHRWARTQPWCDAARVALAGHSYGGYMTMFALTQQPGLWRAGAALAGSVDQVRFLSSLRPATRASAAENFGDPFTERELVERFSPIRFLDKVEAPVFVWQGEKDPVVHTVEAESIVAGLGARGIPVEYMLAGREEHEPATLAADAELTSRMARFLEEHMR